jgi:hypothetical protein
MINTFTYMMNEMKTKIIIAAILIQLSGCASWRYPNWEYVRIEQNVPEQACVYKFQESCSQQANTCLKWHQKRATKYNANTVVITQAVNQASYKVGLFRATGGDNTSTLADYYFCNTPKNITPRN